MSTERQQNAASLPSVAAIFACVFLIACSGFSLAGCSNAAVTEEPPKKKDVVQDLNVIPDVVTPSNAAPTIFDSNDAPVKEPTRPEDEIESLPFDLQDDQVMQEEKELPVLED